MNRLYKKVHDEAKRLGCSIETHQDMFTKNWVTHIDAPEGQEMISSDCSFCRIETEGRLLKSGHWQAVLHDLEEGCCLLT